MTADTYLGNIIQPLSLNLYVYVQGNPVRWKDPSGHTKCESNVNRDVDKALLVQMIDLVQKELVQFMTKYNVVDGIKISGSTILMLAYDKIEFGRYGDSDGNSVTWTALMTLAVNKDYYNTFYGRLGKEDQKFTLQEVLDSITMLENAVRDASRERIKAGKDIVAMKDIPTVVPSQLAKDLGFPSQTLSSTERLLWSLYPDAASTWLTTGNKAKNQGGVLFGVEDLDTTDRNAFVHAYWQAMITYDKGADVAKLFGDAHEFGRIDTVSTPSGYAGSNDYLIFELIYGVQMDLYNNEQGRKAGSDSNDRKDILVLVDSGNLIKAKVQGRYSLVPTDGASFNNTAERLLK